MKRVALREVTEQVETWKPTRYPERRFSYIDLGSVSAETKRILSVATTLGSAAPSRARQIVSQGDVLISTVRPYLNAVAMVESTHHGATASTGFTVLRPSPGLDGDYLFHWVRSPPFIDHLVRTSTGASYPAVSDRIVKDSTMPLPSLKEQRRIAAILNEANGARSSFGAILNAIDEAVGTLFNQIFGANSHEHCKISELGKITTGRTPATSRVSNFGGPIPFVTPGDLGSGRTAKRTLTIEGALESRLVRAGATMVCCIGTIGKIDRAAVDSAFNQQINAVEWYAALVDDTYGLEVMRRQRAAIAARGSSTTVPLLTKSGFSKIEVPLPPIKLQREFAAGVAVIDVQRARVQRAIDLHDELFASLQSRAFKGGL